MPNPENEGPWAADGCAAANMSPNGEAAAAGAVVGALEKPESPKGSDDACGGAWAGGAGPGEAPKSPNGSAAGAPAGAAAGAGFGAGESNENKS